MSGEAVSLRHRAVAAAKLGRSEEAAALHDRAVALAPDDAKILNSAGFFFFTSGQAQRAIALLRRAIAADSNATEPLFNLALALTGAGRAEEARLLLLGREPSLRAVARYWSIRASAERALNRRRDALASFENATRLDPVNPKAAHGRARMALETGLPASDFYRLVVAAQPADREAWLGYAQALEAEGRPGKARETIEALLVDAPGWVDALEYLAQLRWTSGETTEFVAHYAAAVARSTEAPIFASWVRMLAGVDRFEQAADVAAAARRLLGDRPSLALIEAGYRSGAGDFVTADSIFSELELATPERFLSEARHRLRLNDAVAAEALCAQVIMTLPDDVGAWALRGIAWRLLDDDRSEWLHGQPGLIKSLPLDLDNEYFRRANAYLDNLHDNSACPIGQSVRGGTQTRGGLFDRHEPEARHIEKAVQDAVHAYRSGLPAVDETHPLLRHRDDPWRIAGSWSIRLIDAGRHVAHIHPRGLISSAAYFAVPAGTADRETKAGWLELGRPPVDLCVDLPPLTMIEPRAGFCALFPSTLYHGTRAFSSGKRMSVAIDINLERSR